MAGIHVRGEAGNLIFHADSDVTVPLWLYGGAANAYRDGGGGQDVTNGNLASNTPQIVDVSAGDADSSYTYDENVPSGARAGRIVPNGLGFNGSEHAHAQAAGSAADAAWTFDNLDPTAYYDVYVTWSPTAGASTAAAVRGSRRRRQCPSIP